MSRKHCGVNDRVLLIESREIKVELRDFAEYALYIFHMLYIYIYIFLYIYIYISFLSFHMINTGAYSYNL